MSRHEFRCPACGNSIFLPGEELVEGNETTCGNCGELLVASREFDEDAGAVHWSLIEPEFDLEE